MVERTDKTVLIIGGGPSGIDLTYMLSRTAKRVYFSHHTHNWVNQYPSNVDRIGSIKEITEHGVISTDGKKFDDIDAIVYCTGYKMTFPFMSDDCGLNVDNNCVQPLFKHIININNPTMALIGLTFTAANTQMMDIQVRFAFKYWNGGKKLPPVAEMKADCELYAENRSKNGYPRQKLHSLSGSAVQVRNI